MDGDYAAVHNEHARRTRRSSVCRRRATFDRNVIAFHAANSSGRSLLSSSRRKTRNETSEQQEKQRQVPMGARMRGHYLANVLEISCQRTRSRFAYTIQQ